MTPAPEARFVHVAIDAPADHVYAFARDPANLPRWAPNFARTVRRSGDRWIVEMAEGAADLRFAAHNEHGVLDHWVGLPSGETFYNPMRVVPNGAGSLLAFTLFRQPGWTDDRFEADAALVGGDLDRLKTLVEAASAPD